MFNSRKALEAILYFAEKEKARNGKDIDFIKINKYCYFSEQKHLKSYLKPIFGDVYCALPEGPVPSAIYDMLKSVRGDSSPFMDYLKSILKGLPPFKVYNNHFVAPLRPADIKAFSKSEISVMDEIFERFASMLSKPLSVLSHDEPAWKNAWDNGINEMDFADIIGDKEAWDYISQKEQEAQQFRASFQS